MWTTRTVQIALHFFKVLADTKPLYLLLFRLLKYLVDSFEIKSPHTFLRCCTIELIQLCLSQEKILGRNLIEKSILISWNLVLLATSLRTTQGSNHSIFRKTALNFEQSTWRVLCLMNLLWLFMYRMKVYFIESARFSTCSDNSTLCWAVLPADVTFILKLYSELGGFPTWVHGHGSLRRRFLLV